MSTYFTGDGDSDPFNQTMQESGSGGPRFAIGADDTLDGTNNYGHELRIIGGTDADKFEVFSSTGVRAKASFFPNGVDYDFGQRVYNLTIEAKTFYGGAEPNIGVQSYNLQVLNSPTPSQASYSGIGYRIDEGSAAGTAVGSSFHGVAVPFEGSDGAGRLQYSLIDNAGGRFRMVQIPNGTPGQYQIESAVGNLTAATHTVRIAATDGTSTEFANLSIQVRDLDPTTPTDIDATAGTNAGVVVENAAVGTLVGITARATDPGGRPITYKVYNDANQIDTRFAISASGVVTVADNSFLDFESYPSLGFRIEATDGVRTSVQRMTVAITDVNDAPSFAGSYFPAVRDPSGALGVEFRENGKFVGFSGEVRTLVVGSLLASDQDREPNDTLTHTLSGADAALFDYNAATGQIAFKVAPNFEAPADSGANNVYDLVVTANDGQGGSTQQAIRIDVTNENEAPTIAAPASFVVTENTKPVGVIQATDPDAGATIQYFIDGGDDRSEFVINPATGALEFRFAPSLVDPQDWDGDGVYEVTVLAVDNGSPGLRDTHDLLVTVEAAPVTPPPTDDFASTTATTGMLAVNGTAIGRVETGSDRDWFRVSLSAGQVYTITETGSAAGAGGGTLPDTLLRLRNAAGTQLSENDDVNGSLDVNSRITFTPTSSGTYFVDAGGYGAFTGTYTVSLAATALAGSVSISDVAIDEGDAGSKVATFTVSRTGGTAAFSVGYATANGTATTADGDYLAANGTLTFAAGVNSQTIAVTIRGDTKVEGDQTFSVALSGATNGATISDGSGAGVIRNDDQASSDFDGDGFGDVLYQNANGQAAVWTTNGLAATRGGLVGGNPGPTWNLISSGDFDGNGRSDFLWQSDSGQAAVWSVDGFSFVAGGSIGGNVGPTWDVIDAGDFDGDGIADILWQNENGQAAVWITNALGFESGGPVGGNPGPSWHVRAAADFTGDGRADILWQHDSGQAAIWTVDGLNWTGGGGAGGNPGAAWRVVDAGDFNGDGRADILWQHDGGQAAVWLMDGTTFLAGGGVGGNPGAGWRAQRADDFNADGRADILWRNDDGAVAVWTMDGTTFTGGAVIGNPGADWDVI